MFFRFGTGSVITTVLAALIAAIVPLERPALAGETGAPPERIDFSRSPLPRGAICRFGKVIPAVPTESAWGIFSADGKTFATGDGLWSSDSGAKIVDIGTRKNTCIALLSNGTSLLASDSADGIRLSPLFQKPNTNDGTEVFIPARAKFVDWYFSIIAAKKPDTVEAWNFLSNKNISEGESQEVRIELDTYGLRRVQVFRSPDHRFVAWCDGRLFLWNLPAAKISTLGEDRYFGSPTIVFSPDSKRVAQVARGPDRVQVFDSETATHVRTVEIAPGETNLSSRSYAAFSSDGRFIFVDTPRDDTAPRIHKLDVVSGERSEMMIRGADEVDKFAFSLDGSSLQILGQSKPCALKPETQASCELGALFAKSLAMSHNGTLLALRNSSRGGISLREVASGREIIEFSVSGQKLGSSIFSPGDDRLATLISDGSVVIWDLTGGTRSEKVEPGVLPPLWKELASDDPQIARRATWRMAAVGEAAVDYLEAQSKPVTIDQRQVRRLISDLDNNEYATRERALAELKQIGRPAAPYVRAALNSNPSIELRRSADRLLGAYNRPLDDSSVLRDLRAIESLERIGSPRAAALLKAIAAGAEAASQTDRAIQALRRISQRELRLHS